MKRVPPLSQLFSRPPAIFGTLLLLTLTSETAVMTLLPYLFPGVGGIGAVIMNAFLLTMLIAPVVWRIIALPPTNLALTESAMADAVLQSIADAVISFDANGVIDSLNPAAEKIFGYPVHQIEGESIERILPDIGVSRLHASPCAGKDGYVQVVRPGTESSGLHRDGTAFPVEVSVGRLQMQGGARFVATVHDITALKQAIGASEQQGEFLDSLLQQTVVPIFVLDPEGRVLIWNSACEEMTGVCAEEMLGKDEAWKAFYPDSRRVLAEMVISGELEQAREGYALVRQSGFIPDGLQSEGWYRDRNGKSRYVRFDAAPIRSRRGELLAVIESMEDLTQRKRYEEQLEYQTSYDTLTGLVNRNLLADRVRQALHMSSRASLAVGVFMLDLDNFKLVNETFGQDGGDQLLKTVAERLGQCTREGDTVARQGGDEFVVILSDAALPDTAPAIAARLQEAVARPLRVKGQEITITTSIGISIAPKDGEDVHTLLRNAETALYRAKKQGRHSFQFYTDAMNAKSLARMTIEYHLRRALERDEFSLYYQPKVSMTSGMLTGMEALIRWKNAELGNVPPNAFIPLAEETGLILPIGEWVLKTACAQTKAWHSAGLATICVAVNLSPRQFMQDGLVAVVGECLAATRLDPQFLELEVTESLVMHDVTRVASVLSELKKMGVSLAMDDFGTGYSSLAYLRRFPFDKLKIDHSFVRDITCDPNNATIVKAIIAMAHSLQMKVIAEGVETQAQMNYLHGQGCDEIQGYYFSRPVPAADFERMLLEKGDVPLPLPAAGTPEKTVLVVDDDDGILKALQRLLLMEGYTVLTAHGAARGFELLALNRVAVVVSDFRMPEMNGAEFLGRVKELHPDALRIMLSGHADLDSVTTAINLGAVYKVLYKPWEDADLVQKIGEAFRQYAQQRGK